MNQKLLAAANILIGLLAISAQLASYAVSRQVVDWVSSGLWGGILMISVSLLILFDRPKEYWILSLTCLSIVSGLVMVAIYSWNLNRFFKIYTNVEICSFYAPGLGFDPQSCKNMVTMHGLMIALGLLAILVNSLLLFDICRKPARARPTYFYKSDRNVRNTLI